MRKRLSAKAGKAVTKSFSFTKTTILPENGYRYMKDYMI